MQGRENPALDLKLTIKMEWSKMHKIVFAPDSFKGTMSSAEVCDILDKAFRKIKPGVETVKIPIADGGEGTVDAFLYALGGEKICCKSKNPLFEDIESFYGILQDKKDKKTA